MSERDAFGREKGEDTLVEMGWRRAGAPTPGADPPAAAPAPPPTTARSPLGGAAPAAAAASAPRAAPARSADEPVWREAPRAGGRHRRRRGVMVPLIFVAFVLIAIGGVTTLIQSGSSAIDGITGAIDDATEGGAPPAGQGGSLLGPAALKAALAELPAGRMVSLRVAADRIDAQVVVGGRLHVVQVDAAGEVSDITTPARGGGGRVRADSNAPSRIVRTAAKRAGRRPSRVDYLVLMRIGDKTQWQLFFDDGLHYSASASGRSVRRVG